MICGHPTNPGFTVNNIIATFSSTFTEPRTQATGVMNVCVRVLKRFVKISWGWLNIQSYCRSYTDMQREKKCTKRCS